MLNDVIEICRRWRLVHLVGISGLRARYARSRLGQFWLTISNFMLIACAGIVWSLIWRQEISEFLPYVAAGHILYQFCAGTVNESSGSLTADTRIYINERMPFLMSTAAHLYRHFIILLHNLPIVLVVGLWFRTSSPNFGINYIASIFLVLSFLLLSSYALSLICARFRDLIQLVSASMQVIFLVTPVMWQIHFLPEQYRAYLLFFNPFASMLELLRNPILGLAVDNIAYLSISIWVFVALLAAGLFHRQWGRSIIFWL